MPTPAAAYDRVMPPLTILPAAASVGPSDLVRLFHRAQLQRSRAVAEEVHVDAGTWLRNRELQPLPIANCLLDAALEPGGDPAPVVAEVTAAAGDCPVRGWTLNPSLPVDRTAPLADELARAGWVPRSSAVLRLRQLSSIDPRPPAGVTVVPARAAYGPVRRLSADRFATAAEVEAAVLALDDPHLDGWVALRDGRAVATVGLLTDGEVGTVTDLYVTPAERGRGVGRHLLRRALETGGRAGHRHVLAGAAPGAAGVLTGVGFEPVGTWVQFVQPGTAPRG